MRPSYFRKPSKVPAKGSKPSSVAFSLDVLRAKILLSTPGCFSDCWICCIFCLLTWKNRTNTVGCHPWFFDCIGVDGSCNPVTPLRISPQGSQSGSGDCAVRLCIPLSRRFVWKWTALSFSSSRSYRPGIQFSGEYPGVDFTVVVFVVTGFMIERRTLYRSLHWR